MEREHYKVAPGDGTWEFRSSCTSSRLLPFLVCLFALYAARTCIIMCVKLSHMCLNTHKYTFMAEILIFFFLRLQVLLEGNMIKTLMCMQDAD